MAQKRSSILIQLGKRSDLAIGIGVVLILAVLLFPMPGFIIDFLLVINFMMAFVILLSPLYLLRPVEFSVYPGLLLIVTLYRLSLNVATTRSILSTGSPGHIIEVFGSFMIKGNYTVGIIVFIILFIINFMVIIKGSGRVAEVSARFTLDALPGRQMAIDADLNNGVITDIEARQRREDLRREADFYGSMDGASKFVSGDAQAGIMITFINLIGGIIIGVVQMKMPILQAMDRFTILTIGDGLVSQIPGLLISVSAGIIVTRAGTKEDLGTEVLTQLFREPKVLYVTACVLFLFGLAPGMPIYFFIPMGAALAYFGYRISKSEVIEIESDEEIQLKKRKQEEEEEAVKAHAASPEEKAKEIASYLQVDPLELEIGYSLISLVDENQKGDLLERIASLRKQLAIEIGMLVPPIRIRDNISLVPNQYIMKVRGEEISAGECLVNHYLALDSGSVEQPIKGIQTTEPAFGLPALWISEDKKEIAEMHGYTVIEPAAMIATHLSEMIKSNADLIITRQDVQKLLDNVKKDHEAVVNELVPSLLSVGNVEKVLKNLLHEGVSIRDMVTILETLADYAPATRDIETLTEYVRFALSRAISKKFIASDGIVYGITLAPDLEQNITEVVQQIKGKNYHASLPPDLVSQLYKDLQEAIQQMSKIGYSPLLIVTPTIRAYCKRLIEPSLPALPVLSYNEIPTQIPIQSFVSISIR
jgi:flagellar biosynthesis protein FlhA